MATWEKMETTEESSLAIARPNLRQGPMLPDRCTCMSLCTNNTNLAHEHVNEQNNSRLAVSYMETDLHTEVQHAMIFSNVQLQKRDELGRRGAVETEQHSR